jgi:hypothetical protein
MRFSRKVSIESVAVWLSGPAVGATLFHAAGIEAKIEIPAEWELQRSLTEILPLLSAQP